MIDEYEEQNNAWCLRISTDIYSNTEKLLALKGHLKMTPKEIIELKTNSVVIVGQGAKKRLDNLVSILKNERNR